MILRLDSAFEITALDLTFGSGGAVLFDERRKKNWPWGHGTQSLCVAHSAGRIHVEGRPAIYLSLLRPTKLARSSQLSVQTKAGISR